MHSYHRETAGHGGSGGTETAAGEREFGESDPGVFESTAGHHGGKRRAERESTTVRDKLALERR